MKTYFLILLVFTSYSGMLCAQNVDNTNYYKSVKAASMGITDNAIQAYAANIFPNPADDEIKVQNLPFDNGCIEISTLQGKVVKNLQINKQAEYKISLTDLLSQPYIITLTASDGSSAPGKVIIKQ